MNYEGKRVLVTGANGALGKAVTQRLAMLGGVPVLFDRIFTGNINSVHEKHVVDLCDKEAVQKAVSEVQPVDGVFNLAGGFSMGTTVYEASGAEWDLMFSINVTTLKNVISAAVPNMINQGRGFIVNVGAAGALSGQANMSSYCAAKSAVMSLTESLSEEVKKLGINVNAVLPGIIDTPANREAMPNADFSSWVSTDDLANVICFLGSNDARAIHGVLLPVKGTL